MSQTETVDGPFRRSWRPTLAQFRVPGRSRRRAVLVAAATVVSLCFALAVLSKGQDWIVGVQIFLVSFVGFNAIAMISYDAAVGWRLVDFPWVMASIIAIMFALFTINDREIADREAKSIADISRAFSQVVYYTELVLQNECTTPDGEAPLSEPYEGACVTLKKDLPAMKRASEEFSRSHSVPSLEIFAADTQYRFNREPTGNWLALHEKSAQFKTESNNNHYFIILKKVYTSDAIHHLFVQNNMRHWYLLMAFFVGLRLSKTTAEVLQARAAARKVSSTPPPSPA